MVNINELLQELEEQQRQERIKNFKGLVKMTFKDLFNLIKMVKNSGIEDIKLVDLKKILRG